MCRRDRAEGMSPCKANMGVFVRANSCTRRTGEGYGPLRERLWGFSLFLCLLDEDYQSDGYCMLQQASGKAYFDGYEGESVVWFDEFGGSLFPFSIFLAIVSEWGTRVETKGSSTVFHPKKILISTTRWPCEWWPESRHCQMVMLIIRLLHPHLLQLHRQYLHSLRLLDALPRHEVQLRH